MGVGDFDSGLQSAFESLWEKKKMFVFCLMIAQLNFKWALTFAPEKTLHLKRLSGGELLTLSSRPRTQNSKRNSSLNRGMQIITTCVIRATVCKSLHKGLMSLSAGIIIIIIIINMNSSLFTHNIGWLLLRPVRWRLSRSNIGVSTWRWLFPPCYLSPILGFAVHLDYSIVYCAFLNE